MEKRHTVAMLMTLGRMEIDSSRCYGQAVRNVPEPERDRLARFQAQHDTHIGGISAMLQGLGQLAPVSLPEDRELFTSGMRPIPGEPPEKTLEDMAANERLLIEAYRKEQSPALSAAESRLLDRNLSDELEHLRYLEEKIRELKKERR